MTVFCDNYGCMFIDEDGFCDCDNLSIVGGVCEGSYHSDRNTTDAELDYIEDKSRWHELFGTPERAAETLSLIRCGDEPCVGCPVYGGCHKPNQYPMREWLESEACDER